MLGGRISNADEDEVEEELAALEAEVAPPSTVAPLPSVPDSLPERAPVEDEPVGRKQAERTAMLAS